jgi:hypothetical protein
MLLGFSGSTRLYLLYSFYNGGKFGYIDRTGKIVVKLPAYKAGHQKG